ncbi:ABC-type sugar transport system substrate-binding protein [Mesorhizobium robiniae]|uniref:ABC-type sugar transport system substrate-binding protein n=1 Tax=Mesorhizobium robiniae TaxID=559315 RepID=A0ABV2GFV7_9HYPH
MTKAHVAVIASTVALLASLPTQAQDVISATPYASHGDEWVVYDHDSCKFVPAVEHPASYKAVLRKAKKPLKVAFIQPLTTGPFMALWTPGMQKAAEQAAIELRLFDSQYPSTTQPLVVADAVVQYAPDVVLEGTEVDAVLPALMNKYNKACLPVVLADLVPPPNAIFFAAQQADVGRVGAEYAVEVARQRGWTGADMWAVSCANTEVGSSENGPHARVATFQQKVLEAFPDMPADHATLLDCRQAEGPLDARTKVTDWLTAHPDAKYIISNAITDVQALGMYAAFKAADFGERAILIGTDVDPGAMEIVNSGDPIFVGDVSQAPELRGVYEISLALDIAEGLPVPLEVFSEPVVVHP